MECLNGKIRARERVFRSVKKMNTSVLDDMRVYYNFFTKKHGSLQGKTLAQISKIEVDGINKWFTLIQNDNLSRRSM